MPQSEQSQSQSSTPGSSVRRLFTAASKLWSGRPSFRSKGPASSEGISAGADSIIKIAGELVRVDMRCKDLRRAQIAGSSCEDGPERGWLESSVNEYNKRVLEALGTLESLKGTRNLKTALTGASFLAMEDNRHDESKLWEAIELAQGGKTITVDEVLARQ